MLVSIDPIVPCAGDHCVCLQLFQLVDVFVRVCVCVCVRAPLVHNAALHRQSKLLAYSQSGFNAGHIIVLQLTENYNICESLNKKYNTCIVLYDISKAFDKVWNVTQTQKFPKARSLISCTRLFAEPL